MRLAIGSDSQVRVDPFEEVRELETGARRERQTRHALLAAAGDLWAELARAGRASLGLPDEAGRDDRRSTSTTRTSPASRSPICRSRSRPARRPES